MARVELEKVSKIYPGGVRAVNAIDLNIKDQEFVVLVGPSGCGKSTVLRMVAGLEEISDGEIRVGDRVMHRARRCPLKQFNEDAVRVSHVHALAAGLHAIGYGRDLALEGAAAVHYGPCEQLRIVDGKTDMASAGNRRTYRGRVIPANHELNEFDPHP